MSAMGQAVKGLSVIVLFAGASAAAGQEKKVVIPEWEPPIPTVSIQFPGGTLAEYAKALEGLGDHFNIVVASPEAANLQLPPIRLQSVRADSAVTLLMGDYTLGDGSKVYLMVKGLGAFEPGAAPVFKVWTEPRSKPRDVPDDAQVRVWNIGGLIGNDRPAPVVLTAIETAVELLDTAHGKAEIRYHEDSNLVIASGDPEQLRAIDRVVGGLHEGAEREAKQAAAIGGGDAIAGLFEWIEGMRRFNAEQEDKGRAHEQTVGRVEELSRLLEMVRAELAEKDQRIRQLERQLAESTKP